MKQVERDEILMKLVDGQNNLDSKIESIQRGIYGDKQNQQKGLLDRQAQDEKDKETILEAMSLMKQEVDKNSSFRGKVSKATKISGGGGLAAALASIVVFFKELKEIIMSIFN